MSQSKKVNTARARVKKSVLTRTSCSDVVGTNGPSSKIWQGNLVLQDLGQKLVASGVALKAAQASVNSIESQLDVARGVRDTGMATFDKAYELYVTHAEAVSMTPEDASGLGLSVLPRSTYEIKAPLGVNARYDAGASLFRIHVLRAPGMRTSIIEISTNPADPTSWKRLPGVGAVQALRGYAPGTYWVRAASTRASEQSEFTTPVAVIVR